MSDQTSNTAMQWFQEALAVTIESDDYFKRYARAGLAGDLPQGILVLNELNDRVCKLLANSNHVGRGVREPLLKIFAECNLSLCLTAIELSKLEQNPQHRKQTLDYACERFIAVRDAPGMNIASLSERYQQLYAQLKRFFGNAA